MRPRQCVPVGFVQVQWRPSSAGYHHLTANFTAEHPNDFWSPTTFVLPPAHTAFSSASTPDMPSSDISCRNQRQQLQQLAQPTPPPLPPPVGQLNELQMQSGCDRLTHCLLKVHSQLQQQQQGEEEEVPFDQFVLEQARRQSPAPPISTSSTRPAVDANRTSTLSDKQSSSNVSRSPFAEVISSFRRRSSPVSDTSLAAAAVPIQSESQRLPSVEASHPLTAQTTTEASVPDVETSQLVDSVVGGVKHAELAAVETVDRQVLDRKSVV